MSSGELSQIRKVDFGEGDKAWGVELSIKPFGSTLFTTEDIGAESKALLSSIIESWNTVWPEMLDKLQDGIDGYNTDQKLGDDEFIGAVSHMNPDCYMGDKSDIFVRLEFEEAPLWDYFLRDGKIVHFQPVF